jgi:hypothetical protein
MAAGETIDPFHCACGALMLRASEVGIEQHCRRCDRRVIVPFEQLGDKEHLLRFLEAWRAREKRT